MKRRFAMVRGPHAGKTFADMISQQRYEEWMREQRRRSLEVATGFQGCMTRALATMSRDLEAEREAQRSRGFFGRIWARLREIRLP